MNKLIPPLIVVFISIFFSTPSFSQSPFNSESLIKYDLLTHKTDKPIPFDRSFTLVIEKLSSKNVITIHAYQAEFKNGNRQLVVNTFYDCTPAVLINAAIKDVVLKFNPYSDTLQIFFPPLKPNTDFDINVIYSLSKDCRQMLMKVNAKLAEGTPASVVAANTSFNQFIACTFDKITNRSYTSITFPQYQAFFAASLIAPYTNLSNPANFTTTGILTQNEVHAIDILTTREVSDFKDASYLQEGLSRGLFPDLQLGNIDISKVFQADALTDLYNGHLRLLNLESNIKCFDTLLRRVDRVISKGITNTLVNGVVINLNTVRTNIETIRTNMRNNFSYLTTQINAANTSIDGNDQMKQGVYLAGNTLSSDLKSAGGTILFLDAGLTNIIAEGVSGKATHLPKLYWGVSVYFRPIDKNTRKTRFPKKFDPSASNGCSINPVTGQPEYGPDYQIVTKRTILQHLSLNVGITFGSMINKDFDNFYNNTSLLIGPAYRFARAFKISGGVALLRRNSKNPIISEKKTIAGGYISISTDIDLIQGIKDVTSILFK